jgi:hypothetical protein
MPPLLTRNSAVLAKIEGAEGVDAVPTAADNALLTNDLGVTPQPVVIDTTEHSGSLDVGEPIIGITPMQVTIQCYEKGSGAAGTPPEYGPLLRACGFAETINAGTSVVYDLASTAIPSVTIYVFRSGLRWILLGCRGTPTLTMVSGNPWMFDFTMSGIFGGKADVAVPSLTLDSTRPPVWKGGVFHIAGADAALRQCTIALNNTVSFPDNPNAAEGIDAPQITRRDLQGSMDPLEVLVATRNIFSDFRAGTTRALQAVNGSTAGNILTVDIPAAKYRNETQGDRDGFLMADVPFSAVSVDDGLVLTYP